MTETRFVRRLDLPVSAAEAYAWHARPGAFARLGPPWQRLEIRQPAPVENGSRLVFAVRQGPVAIPWEALHDQVEPGQGFRDVQARGPFAAWAHEHRFEARGEDMSTLVDDVRYRLPLGALGRVFGGRHARGELERLFRYRHAVTHGDMAFHAGFAAQPRLRVAVAGSGGLIGRTLVAMLLTGGHQVIRLERRPHMAPRRVPADDDPRDRVVGWNADTGEVDPGSEGLGDIDALVYLAGEPIAGRWTRDRRRRIVASRSEALEKLCTGLQRAGARPQVVVGASGVGYYGSTSRAAEERHAPGAGFLAGVAVATEDAIALVARRFDARCVQLRIGVVLDPRGGYLRALLPSARLGLGIIVGRGRRRVPWVSLEDVTGVAIHALLSDAIEGPLNVVAPTSVRQAELAATLGSLLRRPTPVRLSPGSFEFALGRGARETVLMDIDACDDSLRTTGYEHRWGELQPALAHVLGALGAAPTV